MSSPVSLMKRVFEKIPVTRRVAKMCYRLALTVCDAPNKSKLLSMEHPSGAKLLHVFDQLGQKRLPEEQDLLGPIHCERRELLLLHNTPLVDGTLGEGLPWDRDVSVADACRSSKWPRASLLLYLLMREFRPLRVFELGTNVGISSAYLATALKRNGDGGMLVTLEGSSYRLKLAKQLHAKLDLRNVTYVQDLFTQALIEKTLLEFGPVDFAFIDGDHEYQSTVDCFELVCEHSTENAVLVFDDIAWSDGMKRAWRKMSRDRRVLFALDLRTMGICVTAHKTVHRRKESTVVSLRHLLFEDFGAGD